MCQRQFSKYTCPTCNVPYCSLVCFRSQSHVKCSEIFYRKEVESDIRTAPSKTSEERLKMLKMLKRFEEDDFQDLSDDESDETDENSLVKRLQYVDINSITSDELWSMLNFEERKKFLSLVNDPSSEIARQLLSSEELAKLRRLPWWLRNLEHGNESYGSSDMEYGSEPELIPVPIRMVKSLPSGPLLLYNVCAVLIAYAYATRQLAISPLSSLSATDPDLNEARRLITQLVPFITDRKSTTILSDVSALVTDVLSRSDPANNILDAFSVVLHDAASLIRPLPVTTVSDSATDEHKNYFDYTSHPHRVTILALSDLSHLFNASNHIVLKLLFYAAHILSLPSALLKTVAEELSARSRGQHELALSSSTLPVSVPPARSET